MPAGSIFKLSIGNDACRLIWTSRRAIGESLLFPATDEGRAQTLAALEQRPECPVGVTVDLVEQSFRKETVPAANPLDVQKIVRRRLDMAFPDAALSAMIKMGKGSGGSEYLFAALPQSPELDAWLATLDAAPNLKTSLSLMPFEAAGFVARLAKAALGNEAPGWTFALSRQRTGGFRHIVARDGKLALTRSTVDPTRNGELREVREQVERDVRGTLSYMARFGFRRDETFAATLIGSTELEEILRDTPEFANARFVSMDPRAACRSAGCSLPDDASIDPTYGDLALLAAVNPRRPGLDLAPSRWRREKGVQSASKSLAAIFGCVALGVAGAGAMSGYATSQDLARVDALETRERAARATLEETRAEYEAIEYDVVRIKRLIEASDRFADPEGAVADVLSRLSELGALRLKGLKLERHRPSSNAARARSNAARLQNETPRAFDLRLVLDLGNAPSPEEAAARLDAYAAALARAFPQHDVEITRNAEGMSEQSALEGDIGERSIGALIDESSEAELTAIWSGDSP